MTTPIVDFIRRYAENNIARLHMPGHKGKTFIGCEVFDITEIKGADVLYHADGIIAESEDNCTSLFGTAHSFYSTEGSTLAIKAMLSLVVTASREEKPLVLAARNAHKAFLYAAAWLDFEIKWLTPSENDHLCACRITKEALEDAIRSLPQKPSAVYLTSPDYLGNLADLAGIAAICQKQKIPLLVDNAHGAYLKFLPEDLHPITLGATMCCDSAHKTLPVLTGGAYLHIAQGADPYLTENARNALASFASTSPSYLVLASLDLCNAYLHEKGRTDFADCFKKVDSLKKDLEALGFSLFGNEPLKLAVYAPDFGYTAEEVAEYLQKHKIECEFADTEYLVLMFSPQNTSLDFARVKEALKNLPKKDALKIPKATLPSANPRLTPRKAILARSEVLPTEQAVGRIAASPTVSCPPAIPIVISGEIITKEVVKCLLHYGIDTVSVVKE